MITAVDTCILIDVFGSDPVYGAASATWLRKCIKEGTIIACDVVWAETRVAFPSGPAFAAAMQTLGVGLWRSRKWTRLCSLERFHLLS